SRARDDVTDICEGGGERQKRKAPRKILDAVANPETSLGRKQLEQDGAGGDRGERCQREQHALEMIGADSKAMPDDESDAGYTKQQAERLAPGHDLAEEQRGERRSEHRVGAGDEAADAGGDRLQAGIAEAEIERVVGKPEQRIDGNIAQAEVEAVAAQQ